MYNKLIRKIHYNLYKDSILAYKKKWRKDNNTDLKIYYSIYYENHKPKIQHSNKKWLEKQPKNYHAQAQKRLREKWYDIYYLQKRIYKKTKVWMSLKQVKENREELEKWITQINPQRK